MIWNQQSQGYSIKKYKKNPWVVEALNVLKSTKLAFSLKNSKKYN
jgi:hypothetical protein